MIFGQIFIIDKDSIQISNDNNIVFFNQDIINIILKSY